MKLLIAILLVCATTYAQELPENYRDGYPPHRNDGGASIALMVSIATTAACYAILTLWNKCCPPDQGDLCSLTLYESEDGGATWVELEEKWAVLYGTPREMFIYAMTKESALYRVKCHRL